MNNLCLRITLFCIILFRFRIIAWNKYFCGFNSYYSSITADSHLRPESNAVKKIVHRWINCFINNQIIQSYLNWLVYEKKTKSVWFVGASQNCRCRVWFDNTPFSSATTEPHSIVIVCNIVFRLRVDNNVMDFAIHVKYLAIKILPGEISYCKRISVSIFPVDVAEPLNS